VRTTALFVDIVWRGWTITVPGLATVSVTTTTSFFGSFCLTLCVDVVLFLQEWLTTSTLRRVSLPLSKTRNSLLQCSSHQRWSCHWAVSWRCTHIWLLWISRRSRQAHCTKKIPSATWRRRSSTTVSELKSNNYRCDLKRTQSKWSATTGPSEQNKFAISTGTGRTTLVRSTGCCLLCRWTRLVTGTHGTCIAATKMREM